MKYPASEDLMQEARRATGLSDFGAGGFREGLEVLLRSLEQDARLNAEGVAGFVELMRKRLSNRLAIEAWYREHPEIAQLSIDGPISITGLPRTGTTALANMLSIDDQFRCLRGWEQAEPCPPPILAEEHGDPRRVTAAQHIELLLSSRPDQKAMHIFETDATTEDSEVLGLEFHSQQYTVPAYGYHAWWRDTSLRATFAYHRRVVLLLQSRRPPNRWLFKAPHHKFHLEDFVSAYPDARFIMTHRDPAKVVPSYASFVLSLFPPRSHGEHDAKKLGRELSEHLRIGMERAIAARKRIGEQRFHDVHHRDFERDPFGTLERAYAFLGLELRAPVRAEMQRWHALHHSGAHGTHRYTPEQFGLSKAQLRSDYGFYIRQFDVAAEG